MCKSMLEHSLKPLSNRRGELQVVIANLFSARPVRVDLRVLTKRDFDEVDR